MLLEKELVDGFVVWLCFIVVVGGSNVFGFVELFGLVVLVRRSNILVLWILRRVIIY